MALRATRKPSKLSSPSGLQLKMRRRRAGMSLQSLENPCKSVFIRG